jgi:hypothetical protein
MQFDRTFWVALFLEGLEKVCPKYVPFGVIARLDATVHTVPYEIPGNSNEIPRVDRMVGHNGNTAIISILARLPTYSSTRNSSQTGDISWLLLLSDCSTTNS